MWRAAGLCNGFHLPLVDFLILFSVQEVFLSRSTPAMSLAGCVLLGNGKLAQVGAGSDGSVSPPGRTCVRSTTAVEDRGIFSLLEMGNSEEKGDFIRMKCLLALVQPKHHCPHSGWCSVSWKQW